MDKLVLPVVLMIGGVELIHSLFLVGTSEYIEKNGELWRILGELPASNIPHIIKLTPALFASNTLFFGTDLEEFEARVTGLSSPLPMDLDTTAHQPVLEYDEDACKIYSRETTVIPSPSPPKYYTWGLVHPLLSQFVTVPPTPTPHLPCIPII